MSRFDDALFAQAGACNPAAVLRSMVRHLDGDRTIDCRTDPAMRLMLHQVAFLMKISEMDADMGQIHEQLMVACAKQASADTIRICKAEHYVELGLLTTLQQQGVAAIAVADAP